MGRFVPSHAFAIALFAMSTWSDLPARVNAAQLRVFGEPIVYRPNGGVGAPVEIKCIPTTPGIDTSAALGYFADVHVDPADVPYPQKKDEVDWSDGVTYTVSKVSRPLPDSMYVLALHRKFDPL